MSNASTEVCCDLFVSESGAHQPGGAIPASVVAKIYIRANLVWLANSVRYALNANS